MEVETSDAKHLQRCILKGTLNMYGIAITGGIACGKSLLCKILSRLGADVIDSDEIVKKLHESGGEGAKVVRDNFGVEFISEDGATNRVKLAELVFSDNRARDKLGRLLHPLVDIELKKWKTGQSSAPVRIAQIPLLFELGWHEEWDLTVCVVSKEENQIKRLQKRGIGVEEAKRRIRSQMPNAQKVDLADIVINNDGSENELVFAARELYKYLENGKHGKKTG
jgi:dephospho-CoA kinase